MSISFLYYFYNIVFHFAYSSYIISRISVISYTFKYFDFFIRFFLHLFIYQEDDAFLFIILFAKSK